MIERDSCKEKGEEIKVNYFRKLLEEEIKKEEKLLKSAKAEVLKAPEGKLVSRKRKIGVTYYQRVGGHDINISDNPEVVNALKKKCIDSKATTIINENLKNLKVLSKKFMDYERSELLKKMPKWYHFDYDKLTKADGFFAVQNMELYNPKTHVHKTSCGIYVRSKSEVIIVEILCKYRIPFYYEKAFYVRDKSGRILYVFYPDFTIPVTSNYYIIWEHFGLLSDPDYCLKSAKKLNDFQMEGFELGENLIITMDNSKGSCSSTYINKIVSEQLLPILENKANYL